MVESQLQSVIDCSSSTMPWSLLCPLSNEIMLKSKNDCLETNSAIALMLSRSTQPDAQKYPKTETHIPNSFCFIRKFSVTADILASKFNSFVLLLLNFNVIHIRKFESNAMLIALAKTAHFLLERYFQTLI